MKTRLAAIAAVVAVLLGVLFAAPAAAQNSTVQETVVITSGTYPGSAYATAVVNPDVSAPAAGSLTYSLFVNSSSCGGSPSSTDQVSLNSNGSVPDSTPVTGLGVGTDSFEAFYNGDGVNDASLPGGTCEPFTVAAASPTVSIIGDTNPGVTGNITYDVTVTGPGAAPTGSVGVADNGGGTCSIGSLSDIGGGSSSGSCSIFEHAADGPYTVTATYNGDANYSENANSVQETVNPATPGATSISNIPHDVLYGGSFVPTFTDNLSDGTPSATSTTTSVCTVSNSVVSFVGVGTCTLTAQTGSSGNYTASPVGAPQGFTIGRAAASTPSITNIPSPAKEFFGFTAIVGTTGDGTTSVTSSTPKVCSVGSNGLTVTFVGFGTCTLTPSVALGPNHFGATGSPESFPVQEASHGYWLVGSDGGIFSFGSALFHGSMGGTPLQRPVVAITPTSTGNGYWLVASDGGIFSFGDASYYGSIPGLGLHPAGSGLPHSLNAPIVGMVPSFTGHGYFMVASDGGVFAFGDAKFAGSCPGIGGCAGAAVAVMPDHSGDGYWLVTTTGHVYAFGDAGYYGAPSPSSVPVVDAVATHDGNGYWLLFANGVVDNFGDAANFGAPVGYVNEFNPATTIFPTDDDQGYWVASARGDVFSYGDSPFLGSMAAAGLDGEIIGAFGF